MIGADDALYRAKCAHLEATIALADAELEALEVCFWVGVWFYGGLLAGILFTLFTEWWEPNATKRSDSDA